METGHPSPPRQIITWQTLVLLGIGLAAISFSMLGAHHAWLLRTVILENRKQDTDELAAMARTLFLVYLGVGVLSTTVFLAALYSIRRMARREIALAELKSGFVADVSHELKTPLALIRLYGETLQSGRVANKQKEQEYLAIITRESTRLTNLINNILDFSRIEAGRKDYDLKPCDLGEIVRDTYEAYRLELDHHGFEHHLRIAPDVPKIKADADAIAQVLLNLVSNAIKYSGDERYLGIDVRGDTRRGSRCSVISVEDHGIGISPEDREQLFEGFYRSNDQRVRHRRGTGLGLSLAKHIVDAHDGFVEVESRLVKGSTFRIFFPALEASVAETPEGE